jgi:ABC-type lipoprotein release transport system permease subunit
MKEGIRRRLQHEMPGASYVTITPLNEIIGSQTRSWQLGATMFVTFGVLALVLAAIGLYSVIAYNVAQRTHEMGVRVALGAQMSDVVSLVLTDGLRLSVAGLAIGTLIALWAAKWVKPLLFDESPRDPYVFVIVGGTLLGVAILASLIPARRAAKVEPTVALRGD